MKRRILEVFLAGLMASAAFASDPFFTLRLDSQKPSVENQATCSQSENWTLRVFSYSEGEKNDLTAGDGAFFGYGTNWDFSSSVHIVPGTADLTNDFFGFQFSPSNVPLSGAFFFQVLQTNSLTGRCHVLGKGALNVQRSPVTGGNMTLQLWRIVNWNDSVFIGAPPWSSDEVILNALTNLQAGANISITGTGRTRTISGTVPLTTNTLQAVLDAGNTGTNDYYLSGNGYVGGVYMTDGTIAFDATGGIQIVSFRVLNGKLAMATNDTWNMVTNWAVGNFPGWGSSITSDVARSLQTISGGTVNYGLASYGDQLWFTSDSGGSGHRIGQWLTNDTFSAWQIGCQGIMFDGNGSDVDTWGSNAWSFSGNQYGMLWKYQTNVNGSGPSILNIWTNDDGSGSARLLWWQPAEYYGKQTFSGGIGVSGPVTFGQGLTVSNGLTLYGGTFALTNIPFTVHLGDAGSFVQRLLDPDFGGGPIPMALDLQYASGSAVYPNLRAQGIVGTESGLGSLGVDLWGWAQTKASGAPSVFRLIRAVSTNYGGGTTFQTVLEFISPEGSDALSTIKFTNSPQYEFFGTLLVNGSAPLYSFTELDPAFRAWTNGTGISAGESANGGNYGVGIGYNAQGYTSGVGLGEEAEGYNNGVGIGSGASGQNFGIAIGNISDTRSGTNIAIGYQATIPAGWQDTTEIGTGEASFRGGFNFQGRGIINSNGIVYSGGNPVLTNSSANINMLSFSHDAPGLGASWLTKAGTASSLVQIDADCRSGSMVFDVITRNATNSQASFSNLVTGVRVTATNYFSASTYAIPDNFKLGFNVTNNSACVGFNMNLTVQR